MRRGSQHHTRTVLFLQRAALPVKRQSDIKERSGAKYMVMEPDVPVTEDGGKSDFFYGDSPEAQYRPAKVDRVLHDGDQVKLGGAVLTAHLTPGHTRGCTTWTMKVSEGGKTYDSVIVGSPNVNAGFRLVNNAKYPRIAEVYVRNEEVPAKVMRLNLRASPVRRPASTAHW